jgi:PAS domain S-box-containing protein
LPSANIGNGGCVNQQAGPKRVRDRFDEVVRSYIEAPPRVLLPMAGALALLIALVDRAITSNVSVGLLYALPIMLAAPALSRWQMLLVCCACSALREHYAPFSWEAHAELRLVSALIAFVGSGLFVRELVQARRMVSDYAGRLQEQSDRREEAEHQLQMIVESSPAAIITVDSDGLVDMANQAAHELLLLDAGALPGRGIRDYLPVISELLASPATERPFRSATNGRGRRSNGETFLACIWFSTYSTPAGNRLAAVVTDSSEDLRDWQEASLQSLLQSTRVLVGSVSHEVRNICAAISVVHANLGRLPGIAGSEDYAALGTLAQGLSRLSTIELQAGTAQEPGCFSLDQALDEFRIVMSPTLEAAEVELEISAPDHLPMVQGERHGVLQALLNLGRNSLRAMEHCSTRRIAVQAQAYADCVMVRFSDSGPGVIQPDKLFQPFQPGADNVGLGLFVSRAIVRAGEGELYYEPSASGCTMCLKLKPSRAVEAAPDAPGTEVSA